MGNTYNVTGADGHTYTRKTTRTYTHVVLVTWRTSTGEVKIHDAWCGSATLAEKKADSERSQPTTISLEVLAVDGGDGLETLPSEMMGRPCTLGPRE